MGCPLLLELPGSMISKKTVSRCDVVSPVVKFVVIIASPGCPSIEFLFCLLPGVCACRASLRDICLTIYHIGNQYFFIYVRFGRKNHGMMLFLFEVSYNGLILNHQV